VPDPAGEAPDPAPAVERGGPVGTGVAPVALGGGALGVLGIVVYLAIVLAGGRHSLAFNALEGVTISSPRQSASAILDTDCSAGATTTVRRDCKIVAEVDSVQSYWQGWFRSHGKPYRQADTVFFSGLTGTGCGPASSDVGPFYCPSDGKVYIDLGFIQALDSKFGAKGGPFAAAYVLAHEYGHHVQDLLGELKAGSHEPNGALRVELQAGCYAGVWTHRAVTTGVIRGVTHREIAEGLAAAAAVGAGRIQSEAEGQVDAETWTQGSSAERQEWFLRGYDSGDPADCDTSSAAL
jgi:predicted metalloprotease